MKLARFSQNGVIRLGVVEGDQIVDLAVADASLPGEMNALLAGGPAALDRVAAAVSSGSQRLPLADVHLESPLERPPKILAVGVNYATHAEEAKQAGLERPKVPMIFNKQSTSITGPSDPVHLPRVSKLLDYEGELGIVIGQRCRHVARQKAAEVVAGYTVVNDVTVRDWQFKSPTFTMGKSFDTHCPTGPWIVTPDELGDPHGLQLRTFVNEELRQDAKTDGLLFDCWEIIEHLSTAFTLEPGDLIATGTPAGVGVAMKPPVWLEAGDVVRVEIEGIGTIENPVIDEPEGTARIG